MKLKYLTICLFVVLKNELFAQEKDSINKVPMILTASFYHRDSPLSFDIKNKNVAYYVSNNRFVLKLGVVYKGLGIRYGFPVPILNLGKKQSLSDYIDLHGDFVEKNLIFDIAFRYGKGFSETNSKKIAINQKLENITHFRDDIKTKDITFWSAYAFSRDFNYKASFKNLTPSSKNVICPYIGVRIQHHGVDADSSFFPKKIQDTQNPLTYMQKIITNDFSTTVGIAASIGMQKKWFMAGIFGIGPSLQNQRWTDIKYNERFQISQSIDIRTNMGYNNDRFYISLSSYFDYVFAYLPNEVFHFNRYLNVSLNGGIRIKPKR